MECLNRIQLIGYVVEEARLSQTSNGVNMAQFKIVTQESYTLRTGELKERKDYHYIVCYKGLANIASSLLNGEKVYIDGKQEHWYNSDEEGAQVKSSPVVCQTLIKMARCS